MDIRLIVQSTPNPNALKFVTNQSLKSEGNITYKSSDDCGANTLAQTIFECHPAITEVYLFDNYVTVTQKGSADWDELEQKIRVIIQDLLPSHNPDIQVEEKKSNQSPITSTPEMDQINAILDETVRPALQMDGGDIQIVGFENNTVRVLYQGACGSCPSASMGTMKAIENILKDQVNPDITVEMAETF